MNRSNALLVKRIFDIIASTCLLVLFSPIFILVAIVIWTTMGRPIFFTQQRLGLHGAPFIIIKFRTMNDNRDSGDNLLPDEERLTEFGKFLRSTTLDELPGLINILKGEMSAVGPRPLLVDYRELYTVEQWRRHEMLPGMAGPVIAGGRNTLDWDEKFQLDVWYVDNWSLWLDSQILYNTIVRVFKREGTSAEGFATMPKFTGSKKRTTDD